MKEKAFAIFLLLMGLSAVSGGYGLIFMEGLGMPASYVSGWPFYGSFIGPGLLLGVVVGGANLAASYLLLFKHKHSFETAITAGFGIMIFEFFELYITRQPHILQILYFFLGITTVIFSCLVCKKIKLSF